MSSKNHERIILIDNPIGTSGTEIYSGYIQEDYLSELRDSDAADIYDKMRRSDTQIKMVLSAVKNPIKSAKWYIEPTGEDGVSKYLADFIHFNLFEDLDKTWRKKLHEILSMIDFGYSAFEVTHKIVKDEKTFGTYVGLASLGWRSPRTIERFNVDSSGKLESITQISNGDLGVYVDIPAEYLHIFAIDDEGANYSGISMLRAPYGAWLRKQQYLKWMAIGIESTAKPTPVGKVPEGKENSPEFTRFKEVLAKYMTHQSQYITLPQGWDIEFKQTGFEPDKVVTAIELEDKAIVKSFLANFLELGISSSGGSYSLSFDQSDFFLGGLTHIADLICEEFNKKIIPSLIKLNFGQMNEYPKLCYSGIDDKAGQELATVLQTLSGSKVIYPDQKLESYVRQKYNLPEADEETKRIPEPKQMPNQNPIGFAQKKNLKFAEKKTKAHKLIGDSAIELKKLMQDNIDAIGKDLANQLVTKFKSLPYSRSLDALNKVDPNGSLAFKQELRDFMTQLAGRAIEDAKVEVGLKASEKSDSILFAKTKSIRFESLPKSVRDRINAESALLVGSYIADIEKILFFSYASIAPDSDSAKIVEAELKSGIEDYKTSPSVIAASGNTASKIVNTARQAYFFESDVLDKIESFTFVNPDPVAPICQELVGTTVSVDDPALTEYQTPLHHNCKSTWRPNLKGIKNQPDISGAPTLTKKAQDSMSL